MFCLTFLYTVCINFSKLGYGAILAQKYDKTLKPVAYRSKTLGIKDVEKNQYILKTRILKIGIRGMEKYYYLLLSICSNR